MTAKTFPYGTNPVGGGTAKAIATGVGSAFGPIGGLLGNIVGGLFGRSGQQSANEANLAIARENRAWQERMSNTAYQRSALDLEKAGLNRILALGQPASTPAGNIATMQNKNAKLADSIGAGVNTALQATKLRQEIKESNSRILLNQSTANKNAAQSTLIDTQQVKEATLTAGIRTSNQIATLDHQIKQLGMTEVYNQYQFAEWLATSDNNLIYRKLKAAAPIVKDFAQAVGTITGAFNLRNILSGGSRRSTTTQTTRYDRYGVSQGGSVTTRGPM